MIEMKETHEAKAETTPSILSMAMEIGRMESILEAVERWYEHQVEINKGYKSILDDLKPLGIILGIEEEFVEEEEEKPETKATANININVEASNV